MGILHQISGGEGAARRADVVFVHGLGGDAFKSWRYGEDAATSWPHLLGQDFPEVGVWSLGYAADPSRWFRLIGFFWPRFRNRGQGMALPDRARQLLDLLAQRGLGEHPLLFICHSLGGLIVKQILRTSSDSVEQRWRKIFENTRAVMFLATPHAGAGLASLASAFRVVFGPTLAIQDLHAHDAHLRDLFNWYRNHAADGAIYTATYFEQRAFNGVTIVNPTTAHPGTGVDPVGLDEDHISIAKPLRRDSQVFAAASEIIRNYLIAERATSARDFLRVKAQDQAAPFIPLELPPSPEEFFGREAELERLTERLRASKNTAVVGPAGIGKTALAAKALLTVVGENIQHLSESPFPDGVVFLDLYALRGAAESAWQTLANKLVGASFMERSPARERAVNACHARRVLIVIEGGEEADGQCGRATIGEILSVLSPQNRWLLLTRLSTQAAVPESVALREALQDDDAGRLFDELTRSLVPPGLRGRALALLEGHPLALTWAANLLARDDEAPERLLDDWTAEQLPSLNDPRNAEHTLQWLFNRSVSRLDPRAQKVLAAAALLGPVRFPIEAIDAVLCDPVSVNANASRQELRTLVQRSLLRRSADDRWQFTHVLGYRFARQETGSDSDVRVRLGNWLRDHLAEALAIDTAQTRSISITDALEHLSALLRADHEQTLWTPITKTALLDFASRLSDLGQLGYMRMVLNAVADWLSRIPDEKKREGHWHPVRAILFTSQGDLLRAQGDLPGALVAYRESLRLRRRLTEVNPSNLVCFHELGVSLQRVADVLLEQGDLPGALAMYRESIDFIRRVAKAAPSNAACQRDLGISHIKIGDVLRGQGDLDGALAAYQAQLQLMRRLARVDQSNVGWQRDLSVAHVKVGDVLNEQGNLQEALAAYQASHGFIRPLAEAEPSNTGWQRDLSTTHGRVGDVLKAQGDLAGALAAHQESLRLSRRLTEIDPSNAGWQRDLCVSQHRVADVLTARGDLTAALGTYQESLQISRSLAEADPSNATWRRNLSISCGKIGDVLRVQGDLTSALVAYRESLQLIRPLVDADPSNAVWQRDLSVNLENVANVLKAQGDLPAAIVAYRESLQLIQRLARTDPTNTVSQRSLSVSYIRLGDVQKSRGDLPAALQAYNESLRLNRQLTGSDPTNTVWQRNLGVSLERVADVLSGQGDFRAALVDYQESLQLIRRLAQADPTNTDWQRNLGIIHGKIGDVLKAQGDFDDAHPSYIESLKVFRLLTECRPSNANWQDDLSIILRKEAELLERQGDRFGALQLAQESLKIKEQLAKLDSSNAAWRGDVTYIRDLVARLRK